MMSCNLKKPNTIHNHYLRHGDVHVCSGELGGIKWGGGIKVRERGQKIR